LAWPDPSYAEFRWAALANAVIAGVALSVSGVLLQALLRNPLASPFILGVSSGAGLGVTVALYLAYATGGSLPYWLGTAGPAIAGAMGALGLVYGLSLRRGWIDPLALILIGVIVSAICSAGMMFFQHLVPTGLRGEFTAWLMGYIPETATPGVLLPAGILTGAGLSVAVAMGRALDAVTLSEDEARSVGVAVGPTRLVLFLVAGALAAVAVVVVGPIGFVGLIAPHMARLILGARHFLVVIGAAMWGVVVLVGADVIRQMVDFGAGRMPPGIFTAAVGGPLFIWLLRTGRGSA
jgi:iron complex transport system permease protein